MENIVQMQGVQELRIAQIEAGEQPEPPKRKYRDYEKRLKTIVGEYTDELTGDDLKRYIRSVATVLNFDITTN